MIVGWLPARAMRLVEEWAASMSMLSKAGVDGDYEPRRTACKGSYASRNRA